MAQSVQGTGLLGATPTTLDVVAMYSKTGYQGGYQKEKKNYVSTYNLNAICDH